MAAVGGKHIAPAQDLMRMADARCTAGSAFAAVVFAVATGLIGWTARDVALRLGRAVNVRGIIGAQMHGELHC